MPPFIRTTFKVNSMKLIKLIILVVIWVSCHNVYAASCTSRAGSYTFNGSVTIQRDAPVGYITPKFSSNGTVWGLNCTGDSTADSEVYWTIKVPSSPVAGYTNVYATNLNGIGVMYNFALNSGSQSFCNVQFDDHIDNSTRTYTCHLPKGTNQDFSLGSSLQFVKLSNNLTSGIVTSIPTVMSSYALNNQSGTWNLNNIWAGNGSLVVTAAACSINASNLTFPIGDVPASSFGTTVGTTPSIAQNTQFLGLNCTAGANINVRLSGIQNPDISNSSVLALTGQGSSDVAGGVGVQLIYNGSPLVINNRIVLKQSTGGSETFPITARYYQTKTIVTGGKANATATLDLTYQ